MEMVKEDNRNVATDQEKTIIIASNSHSAIQAIAQPKPKAAQAIIHDILQRVETLRKQGVKVQLR